MPHIGTLMERSLGGEQNVREAFVGLLVRSVQAAGLGKRQSTISNIEGQITDVKTAFSSWDNCMQATFCKWPVIAVIIIGGLFIFSIVWCIIRCACCGLSCCCECCYCLKCCGSCCGMCDAPQKRHKYLDEPYVPPHHDQGQGYRPQAPMMAPSFTPARPEPPQYAEFETGKKGSGDELPQMPSWEGAGTKKVMVEEEAAVELEQLKKPEVQSQTSVAPMGASATSFASTQSRMSPHNGNSPYGMPQQDAYSRNGNGQAYNDYNNGGYGQASREDMSQGYGNQGYGNQGYGNQNAGYGMMTGAAMGQRSRTPHQDYNNGGGVMGQRTQTPQQDYNGYDSGAYGAAPMDNGYGPPRAATYNEYGRSTTPSNAAYARGLPQRSATTDPYGTPDRMRSPAPLQGGGYGFDQRSQTPNSYGRQYRAPPQRQYSNDSAAYPPAAPQRQYSNESTQPLTRPTPDREYSGSQSPIANNGGFDFTSGYSRAENVSRHGSPAPQQNNGASAYPGYRPYKPQQQQQDGY